MYLDIVLAFVSLVTGDGLGINVSVEEFDWIISSDEVYSNSN